MNNEQQQKLIPALRFPEFANDGQWEVRGIEKNIDMISGIALKSKELTDDKSGTPILRGINITEGHIRHSQDIDKYYLGDTSEINKYLVEENDIVIGMDGSKVGKNVALISKFDKGSILIQRVARIRAIDSDIKYLYQNFISKGFITYVDNFNTSSGIPHISATQIRDFKIGFPPSTKEQQKIANCLSSLDTLITAQTEKLDHLKAHKKGLLQQLFPAKGETQPQLRFPEFENEGDFLNIAFENLCNSISSGKDKNNSKGIYELYGSTGVIGKSVKNTHKGEYILVARVGANAGKLNKISGDFGVTDNTLVINSKDNKNINYLFYWLNKYNLNNLVFGSGQPLITGKQLKRLNIVIPKNPKEQQKIANCLSSADDLIEAQTTKIESLKDHKKGLMQKLFPTISELAV